MEQTEIQRAVLAILFAAGEPVEASRIAAALEADVNDIHRETQALMDRLAFDRSGIRILRLEDAYRDESHEGGGFYGSADSGRGDRTCLSGCGLLDWMWEPLPHS